MLMDGFFSKRLYAAKTERTFITKLNTLKSLRITNFYKDFLIPNSGY